MAAAEPFVRDPVTRLGYGALACYAYFLYALGPLLALLRSELHLSYTLTSVHSSVWAGGTIATGVLFDRLARRTGRRRLLWLSALGAATGAGLFVVGHVVAVTLLAAAVLGTAGTMLQAGTSALLADRHGTQRDRALIEANIGASTAAVLAPLGLGALAATAAGWRVGLLLPVAGLGLLYARYHAVPLPDSPPVAGGRDARGGRLPAAYWLLALLVGAVVAVEFCVIFYGAALLHTAVGMSTRRAATAVSVFYVGELLGRVAGAGLTRRSGRTAALVGGALAVTAGGFVVFWLAHSATPALTGLFVTGLGVANLYPLSLALSVAAAPGRTDEAAARIQLVIGVAVIVAPLTLGAVADRVGVARAFGVEPSLILAAGLLLAAGARRAE